MHAIVAKLAEANYYCRVIVNTIRHSRSPFRSTISSQFVPFNCSIVVRSILPFHCSPFCSTIPSQSVPFYCSTVVRSVPFCRSVRHPSPSITILSNVHPRSVQCPSSFHPTSVLVPSDVRPHSIRHPSLFRLMSVLVSSEVSPHLSVWFYPSGPFCPPTSVHRRTSTDICPSPFIPIDTLYFSNHTLC